MAKTKQASHSFCVSQGWHIASSSLGNVSQRKSGSWKLRSSTLSPPCLTEDLILEVTGGNRERVAVFGLGRRPCVIPTRSSIEASWPLMEFFWTGLNLPFFRSLTLGNGYFEIQIFHILSVLQPRTSSRPLEVCPVGRRSPALPMEAGTKGGGAC